MTIERLEEKKLKHSDSARTSETALSQDLIHALGYYLGGRRRLLVLAAGVVVVGVALNWTWLVAVGVAPLLLALLPCAAMCALGLCMNHAKGDACSSHEAIRSAADPGPLASIAPVVDEQAPRSQGQPDAPAALIADTQASVAARRRGRRRKT